MSGIREKGTQPARRDVTESVPAVCASVRGHNRNRSNDESDMAFQTPHIPSQSIEENDIRFCGSGGDGSN